MPWLLTGGEKWTPDGTGKVMGPSAGRPSDAKLNSPPRPGYAGFRVAQEKQ